MSHRKHIPALRCERETLSASALSPGVGGRCKQAKQNPTNASFPCGMYIPMFIRMFVCICMSLIQIDTENMS